MLATESAARKNSLACPRRKIVQHDKAVKLAQELKTQGKIVITYNGSFDILHAGHVRAIHEAKHKGDVLIILLNSDKSIRSYKGPNRPIIPEQDRAEMLAALEDVDHVVLFNEINPSNLLAQIKPNIHCKSPDWGKDWVERYTYLNGQKVSLVRV